MIIVRNTTMSFMHVFSQPSATSRKHLHLDEKIKCNDFKSKAKEKKMPETGDERISNAFHISGKL